MHHLVALWLYKIYRQAGIPAGVINYLTGPGNVFEDEIVNIKILQE